ncbi:hypothetical protein MRX96_054582 [Rhipicephalus microplus]
MQRAGVPETLTCEGEQDKQKGKTVDLPRRPRCTHRLSTLREPAEVGALDRLSNAIRGGFPDHRGRNGEEDDEVAIVVSGLWAGSGCQLVAAQWNFRDDAGKPPIGGITSTSTQTSSLTTCRALSSRNVHTAAKAFRRFHHDERGRSRAELKLNVTTFHLLIPRGHRGECADAFFHQNGTGVHAGCLPDKVRHALVVRALTERLVPDGTSRRGMAKRGHSSVERLANAGVFVSSRPRVVSAVDWYTSELSALD